MADPLSAVQVDAPKADSLAAKADHGLYTVEKNVAWVSLLVMAGAYFLAILERNLTGGFGENAIDGFILRRMGTTSQEMLSENPALAESIHGFWSPLIFVVGTLSLLAAAALTLRRIEGGPELTTKSRVRAFFVGLLGFGGLVAALIYVPSQHVIGAAVAATFAVGLWQIRAQPVRLAAWIAVLGGALWFVYTQLEHGFEWSKELSMMLLMWVGFIGASVATYEGRNIQVDFVRKNVPKAWRARYELAGSGATTLLTFVLAALAYDSAVSVREAGTLYSEMTVGNYWVPLAVAVGLMAVGLRYGLRCVRLVAGTESIPDIDMAPDQPRGFLIAAGIIVSLAVLAVVGIGPLGGGLIALVLMLILSGAPLYVVIGGLALGCFAFWPGELEWWKTFQGFSKNFNMMERMIGLTEQDALIAIPFFMVAGAVMSRGAIASQLVECARACFGWLPGGLAVSTVMACMFFAAISGSSPVTVITIGAVMYPALVQAGYKDRFSIGLVTSAGSLGIIIPPSIPMIVYAIFASMNGAQVDIKYLFIAGIGPGLVIGTALAAVCVYEGRNIPTEPFDLGRLGRAVKEGFWALFLPGFILVGIYLGLFDAVEASAIAVALALGIELFVHRQLKPRELPALLADSASLMGSILVIIAVALGLSEFLSAKKIPDLLVNYLASYQLTALQFMLMLNVMLIIVGCLMDIISAMILFVPLIVPLATRLGIDPIHLGLVFIVNLEIGYLTPPLGLNLFVSSGFFQKPFGEVMKSVLPFIGALAVSLAIVTAIPTISLGLVNMMQDKPFYVPFPTGKVLKPTDNVVDTATTGIEAIAKAVVPESDAGEGESKSLQAITNSSRESDAEGDIVDEGFETYGVRSFAADDRLVVVITSISENCVAEGGTPEDTEEWYLRIDLPADAKVKHGFDVAKAQIGVELIKVDGEERTVAKPKSGVVMLFESEGKFGAFELQFEAGDLAGKFVPEPCEEGAPFYR